MKPPWSTLGWLFRMQTITDGEPMAATDERVPFPTLRSLEKRSAAIILMSVRQSKTEQEICKALKAGGIDVRRLPSRFVATKIEETLKAERRAADALRVPRKKKAH
jgi:hypothetical protein